MRLIRRRDTSARWRPSLPVALLAAALFALAPATALAQSPSILDPASSNASELSNLYLLIFYMGVGVFLLVEGLIIYAVVKFRRKDDAEQPVQTHGNTRVELAWTLTPAVIVLALALFSHRTLTATFRVPADSIEIQVTGYQWWWEFSYPPTAEGADDGFETATEFVVPVGRPVVLYLEAADVIHSFWAPQLAGKTDAIPGDRDGGFGQNRVWFIAEREGRFFGHCAEFCGTQHSGMRFTVEVVSPEAYDAWLQNQTTPAVAAEAGTLAAQGAELIASKGCQGCHHIDGVEGMVGQVGPDLTHLMSRETLAGGIFENNTENLAQWIGDPQSLKPGALMPDLNLTDEEVDAVVAYLETLE